MNALSVKFRFLLYFMTENPAVTERNAITCPFLVFYCVSTINFSKNQTFFNTLWIKKLSAKSIRRWRKFLPTNIFCRWNFPPTKFLPKRYKVGMIYTLVPSDQENYEIRDFKHNSIDVDKNQWYFLLHFFIKIPLLLYCSKVLGTKSMLGFWSVRLTIS